MTALAVNAAVWTAYFAWALRNAYPAGVILGLITLAVVVAITSAGIGIVHFLLCRNRRAWLRRPAYALPSVLLVIVLWLLPRSPAKPNQTQNLISPSGAYRLSVPIIDDRWRVTIHDGQGNLQYQDEESDFVGWLNVYWIWDDGDRVWLYNSDTGDVFFWEIDPNGRWTKGKLGDGKTMTVEGRGAPPKALYPDYVN